MKKTKPTLTRRAWLRASLAGAGAAAVFPWGTPRARAATEGTPRFVFVIEGNCVEPIAMLSPAARDGMAGSLRESVGTKRNWYRDYTQDDLVELSTPDLAMAKSLGALGPLASRSSVLYGLSNKAGGGGHTPHHGTLSCQRTIGGSPGGETIDALLARQLLAAHSAPFGALRVGVGSRPLNLGTCATAAGQPAAILQNPTTAYDTFIGPVAGSAAAGQRAAMLEFAREDVAHAVERSVAGPLERRKLSDYLGAIESVETQLETLAGWEADPALLPETPMMDPRFSSSGHFDRLGAQFSVATAALRLGLTNVAVVTSGTSGEFSSTSYPSLARSGVPTGRHQLHHESGSQAAQDMIHEVSAGIVSEIAAMANAFAETPDGDGASLLDNTVILYFGDNGETHHSTASEFPVLTVGGENLGFRGGRTLLYPRLASGEHRRLSNLWMSLTHAAGFPQDTFGGEDFTRVAGGPLPALLG